MGVQVDGSDWDTAFDLADLLAECGELDGFRGRADVGDRNATGLLRQRGDLEAAAEILSA